MIRKNCELFKIEKELVQNSIKMDTADTTPNFRQFLLKIMGF